MKRPILILALSVLLTASCGPESPAKTEAALATYYSIGNSATVVGTLGEPINYMYKETQFPEAPVGPSASSAFTDTWKIDNGGVCVTGPDGIHGSGNLNRITFVVYLVNSPVYGPYYVATVDAIFADGGGNCLVQQDYATVTGWPLDHTQMFYLNDTIKLYVLNAGGRVTWDLPAVPLYFFGDVSPTKAYSPKATFGLDTSTAYGGCEHDILSYDHNIDDTGHYTEHNAFGIDGPTFPAYVSAPTTNSKCSLQTFHYPTVGYDIIQWKVNGF